MTDTLAALRDARYVSLTTFRSNGERKYTPVWIAPHGEEFVVITLADTWKVKRIDRNPAVELRPCDIRGRATPDAPAFAGQARVIRGPAAVTDVKGAIGAQYGAWYRVFARLEALAGRVRPRRNPRAGIYITVDPTPIDVPLPPAPMRVRSCTRLVPAAAEAVFELLADPRQHALIDGSGTLRGRVEGPRRLSLGATFSMAMQQARVPYRSVNRVVEFEEGRRIAWETFGEIGGRRIVGGQIWGYELAPRADPATGGEPAGTTVTHTYDWSPAMAPELLERLGYPDRSQRAMAATLDRLADVLAAD